MVVRTTSAGKGKRNARSWQTRPMGRFSYERPVRHAAPGRKPYPQGLTGQTLRRKIFVCIIQPHEAWRPAITSQQADNAPITAVLAFLDKAFRLTSTVRFSNRRNSESSPQASVKREACKQFCSPHQEPVKYRFLRDNLLSRMRPWP